MPLTPGTTLGPYSVTAKIGEGGMGEVYRARDTKLDRDVALKVLPQAFTDDPDRLARFEREAKVLASLNHPNIGHIYGLEEAEGQKALVLELVEGPTLADRIKQGPIPIGEALPIAKQIAEALEAAHEQGVIHRDLKPANIKVRDDGMVKVLDFGLAKAFQPDASDVSASMSPTISLTAAATQMGMVIGTAAYMAPEQARGKQVDKRADIFAFGVVLYEMLTGQRPFQGEDVSLTLAAVMTFEPELNLLPETLSPTLKTYLIRCLAKDPKERLRDIGDVRLAMKGAFETTIGSPLETAVPQVWPRPVPTLIIGVLIAMIAGVGAWNLKPAPDSSADLMRFLIAPPEGVQFSNVQYAVSPDGARLAFVGLSTEDPGIRNLWVRDFGALEARMLPGTEGASFPFWAPDSRAVAFVSAGELKRVDIDGGSPVSLAVGHEGSVADGTWSTDGVILFSALGDERGIFRVPENGGLVVQVTTLDESGGEIAHLHPRFLPGSQHFLYVARGATPAASALYVSSVDAPSRTRLFSTNSKVEWVTTGHFLFLREGTLMAQRFDDENLELVGPSFPLGEQVRANESNGWMGLSVSKNGLLGYRAGEAIDGRTSSLGLVSRDGGEIERVTGPLYSPQSTRLSPDGRQIAIGTGEGELWIYNLDGRPPLPLVSTGASPVWTPDGGTILFAPGLPVLGQVRE